MIEFEYSIVENLTVARCIRRVLRCRNYDDKTEGDFNKIEALLLDIIEGLKKRTSCEEESDE